MANIYDLSERQIYQLRSIDPYLSTGWQKSLFDILPLLDKESQQAIYQRVLEPRGIYYDREKKQFFCEEAKSLLSVLKEVHIDDKDYRTITEHMQEFVEPIEGKKNVVDFADQLEAILSQFDKVYINEEIYPQLKSNIRKAFLYEVAKWIDNHSFEVEQGIRQFNEQIVKSYIKEVYIKHQIQRWDFRSWDSVDIQAVEGVPDWIKKEALIRQYFVVETPHYWFLIGQAERTSQNLYSVRRFLYEDISEDGEYVFLTHIAVPRSLVKEPRVLALMHYCLSRFYTLDRSIGEAVRVFIRETKEHQNRYLRKILRKPLRHDGGDVEQVIHSRMLEYERQLTMLILKKFPRVIHDIGHNQNDQDYLFYHFDNVLRQMIENIEDFRLQPVTRYSISAELMSLRVTCFQLLLRKIRKLVCDVSLPESQRTMEITAPLHILTNQLKKVDEDMEEIRDLKLEVQGYHQRQEETGFWSKLRREKPLEYTMEDVVREEHKLADKLFLAIIRIEKDNRHLMVYPEFEIYHTTNEEYRHYAFADGKLGIELLPKLVRIPEDRRKFNINSVRRAVYFDIFRTN